MREFHRNRRKAIGNPLRATSDARAALDKSRASAARALETWSRLLAIGDPELQALIAKVDAVHEHLREAVEQASPDRVHPTTPADRDPVLGRLSELLDGRVLNRPLEQTWNKLIAEGKERVENLVPPGYLDAGKNEHEEGDDLLGEGAGVDP